MQGERATWTEAGGKLEIRASAVIHSDQVSVPCLRAVNQSASPTAILSLLNPPSAPSWKAVAETGHHSAAATQDTRCVTRVQSPPRTPLGKTDQMLC